MRLIDADSLIDSIDCLCFQSKCSKAGYVNEDYEENGCFPNCDIAQILRMIEDMPFYTSLENYIEEHGEDIDFMFFAPELEQDGDDT